MSIQAIHEYHNEVEKIIHFGGTKKETAIRNAFYHLLNVYAKQKGLMLVPEVTIRTPKGKNVTPDGTLKDSLRQDWGYWESKDEADDINEEIKKKFAKDYPRENILFEDSQTAVLYQNGIEAQRVKMKDASALDRLLHNFINFERPEVKHFHTAIELFKQDIPKVTDMLRDLLETQETTNPKFVKERNKFLKLCHDSINPEVTPADVREMMIQHILTEDIFNTVFDETQFHRENNIARQLEAVISTFFTGATKKIALSKVQHYYQAINAAAAGIADHHEKQNFLKVVYETFYKSYNPKAADRLGVVYTPNEIVRFMIESTDYLLNKHFGKFLEDKGVDILDPATGTGTFICDIIDHISKAKLEYKYKNELHANEVAILPYYISNLNIEFTYTQKMKQYAEFENLCFVDTLDNMGFAYRGKQGDLFAPFTEENSKRIKKQNDRKIAVIIGNPPYNANQANENDNNKNREYPEIDKRIRDTFIKFSTAQKSKAYDPYARFYRWAMDRLDDRGIICFITNNSFINARTFDGFRKCVQEEFQHAYIIDLGGNIRELSGKDGIFLNEKHTIFGQAAAVGIAIMFLVRDKKALPSKCLINYIHPTDIRATRDEKLDYLKEVPFKDIPFEHVQPDKNNNWINLADNDFETLLPLYSKSKKTKSVFELSTNGVSTNRDEWVYDLSFDNAIHKGKFFINEYNFEVKRWLKYKKAKNYTDVKAEANPVVDKFLEERNFIKWSKMIKRDKLRKDKPGDFDIANIKQALYRPFCKQFLFFGYIPIDLKGSFETIFPEDNCSNELIAVNHTSSKDFNILASNKIVDLHFNGDSICLPRYRYDANHNRIENITDWGLQQFCKHYKAKPHQDVIKKTIDEPHNKPATKESPIYYDFEQPHLDDNDAQQLHEPQVRYGKTISKEDIFHYTYAVLHNPAYRKKYELNLKREFPRIPFYKNFNQWSNWGKALMDLHINYETVKPFALKETTVKDIKAPKAKLKADKETGKIIIDEVTTLSGIPPEAWGYKLGNRSALEWVLDQYKESKPKDPTIAEKFNTYKFADYKEQVIDLLKRVTTVSVETLKIIEEMKAAQAEK